MPQYDSIIKDSVKRSLAKAAPQWTAPTAYAEEMISADMPKVVEAAIRSAIEVVPPVVSEGMKTTWFTIAGAPWMGENTSKLDGYQQYGIETVMYPVNSNKVKMYKYDVFLGAKITNLPKRASWADSRTDVFWLPIGLWNIFAIGDTYTFTDVATRFVDPTNVDMVVDTVCGSMTSESSSVSFLRSSKEILGNLSGNLFMHITFISDTIWRPHSG